jgi:hypothetical protein
MNIGSYLYVHIETVSAPGSKAAWLSTCTDRGDRQVSCLRIIDAICTIIARKFV